MLCDPHFEGVRKNPFFSYRFFTIVAFNGKTHVLLNYKNRQETK